MVSPKVVYPNSVKFNIHVGKNPTIKELISRRTGLFQSYVNQRQYFDKDLSQSFYPEFIHGCFMLFKTADFMKLNGFDERYFLYMEDADICREIKQSGKDILYYPQVRNHSYL